LSTVYLEFAAGIEQVKVDCPFGEPNDQADFPAGFASKYPLQALQLASGKTWICHEKKASKGRN
jgi:hypothetical protein